jgi:anti-sigma factor RsiW
VVNDDELLNASLSALADGQATPADWACVQAAWDRDPALRERWALWQCAGDGLRSADLPGLHRDPDALLAKLHTQLPVSPAVQARRPRDWLAPLAVAAGFVAFAVGVSTLQVSPPAQDVVAAAASTRVDVLAGTSFAQTAAGQTWSAPLGAGLEAPRPLPTAATDWPTAWPPQPAASLPAP